MRIVQACLVAVLLAACSRPLSAQSEPVPPAPAAAAPDAGAPVSGVYTANGKPAALTDVQVRPDDPIDGKSANAIVFTVSPQHGDAAAIEDAHEGKFGDALIVRVTVDGTVEGADLIHHGLSETNGYVSTVGVVTIDNYRVSGGEVFGHVTSGGPSDSGDGQKVNVDLTFHAKAPGT